MGAKGGPSTGISGSSLGDKCLTASPQAQRQPLSSAHSPPRASQSLPAETRSLGRSPKGSHSATRSPRQRQASTTIWNLQASCTDGQDHQIRPASRSRGRGSVGGSAGESAKALAAAARGRDSDGDGSETAARGYMSEVESSEKLRHREPRRETTTGRLTASSGDGGVGWSQSEDGACVRDISQSERLCSSHSAAASADGLATTETNLSVTILRGAAVLASVGSPCLTDALSKPPQRIGDIGVREGGAAHRRTSFPTAIAITPSLEHACDDSRECGHGAAACRSSTLQDDDDGRLAGGRTQPGRLSGFRSLYGAARPAAPAATAGAGFAAADGSARSDLSPTLASREEEPCRDNHAVQIHASPFLSRAGLGRAQPAIQRAGALASVDAAKSLDNQPRPSTAPGGVGGRLSSAASGGSRASDAGRAGDSCSGVRPATAAAGVRPATAERRSWRLLCLEEDDHMGGGGGGGSGGGGEGGVEGCHDRARDGEHSVEAAEDPFLRILRERDREWRGMTLQVRVCARACGERDTAACPMRGCCSCLCLCDRVWKGVSRRAGAGDCLESGRAPWVPR